MFSRFVGMSLWKLWSSIPRPHYAAVQASENQVPAEKVLEDRQRADVVDNRKENRIPPRQVADVATGTGRRPLIAHLFIKADQHLLL